MDSTTKLRILYLYQYLLKHSDAEHPISTAQLIADLKKEYDIDVNRNTLANDLAMLNKSGFNIEVVRSQSNSYYIDTGVFDLAELKVLIDAVSSSKFITEKKSKELIEKLLTLTTENYAAQLRRHVYVEGRVKSDNEKGYYIVDAINKAIDDGVKIRFQYADNGIKKRKVLRHDGEYYVVSPYALIWDGDYYYVVGFSEKRGIVQSFRLDRFYRTPEVLQDAAVSAPAGFSLDSYAKSVFRMYDTDHPVEVELLCTNRLAGAIIDRFGKNVDMVEVDINQFTVKVTVCASPTFYRWVFGWNGEMKILSPDNVLVEYQDMARKALE